MTCLRDVDLFGHKRDRLVMTSQITLVIFTCFHLSFVLKHFQGTLKNSEKKCLQ